MRETRRVILTSGTWLETFVIGEPRPSHDRESQLATGDATG